MIGKMIEDEIQYADLPENLKSVADVIGIDATRKLIQTHAGTKIYVPSIKSLPTVMRRLVSRTYKSKSVQEIARQLSISERTAQKFIQELNQDSPQ